MDINHGCIERHEFIVSYFLTNNIYEQLKNIANQYEAESFVIDPNDWALCEDSVDEILGIVHSHPDFDMNFSEADIASCNHLELRFYLVNPISESIIYIDPEKKDAD